MAAILPGDLERLQWLIADSFSIDYALKYIECLGNQQLTAIEYFFPDYFQNQQEKLSKYITYTERCFIHYQLLLRKYVIDETISQSFNNSKFFQEMTKGFLQSILDLEVLISVRIANKHTEQN